jgi:hypothetical protein
MQISKSNSTNRLCEVIRYYVSKLLTPLSQWLCAREGGHFRELIVHADGAHFHKVRRVAAVHGPERDGNRSQTSKFT